MTQMIKCQEIIEKSKAFLRDDKVRRITTDANSLYWQQEAVKNILRRGARTGNLTPRDRGYLGNILENYAQIVQLNQGYDESVPIQTTNLLDSVIEFALPHTKTKIPPYRSIVTSIEHIKHKVEQIKAGEYFWNLHIHPAVRLLGGLNNIGVNNAELEQRTNTILDRLTLPLISETPTEVKI